MTDLIKSVTSIFTYKRPKNRELGFELLEGEDEGTDQGSTQDAPDINNQSSINETGNNKTENKKAGKKPLTFEEWNENRKSENPEVPCQPKTDSDEISPELCVNLATIRQKFLIPKNQDIIIREFNIGREKNAFAVFIDGMIDKQILNLAILPQLMAEDVFNKMVDQCPLDYLIKNILSVHNIKKSGKYSDTVMHILKGLSAIFIEGCNECILIETQGYEKRNVDKPITETVVKGSQEGFTENLRTNITLVRKIIKNENLVTEFLPVGNTNHSNCAVIYLEGIANPKVIQEIKKRIKRINVDQILGEGMIEQLIEDNSLTLFPQVLSTERPDRTASFIMEGQVVVIAEGTPFALTVPVTFFRLFHTSEDSFVRWPYGTFIRLIRLFGLFCATLLPSLYTAIALFHPDVIPTQLLEAINESKENVPFPTLVEVLLMEISFELIREGGIRVPSVIGQTLGIVGALILGQAAVAAGLVSPILVIVVSITGLGSFAIPNYTLGLAIRIEKFLFILAAACFGFYGITVMIFMLAVIVCSMKSFGEPFFAPIAPRTKVTSDLVTRGPIWMQKNRPDGLNTPNRKRQGKNPKVWIAEEEEKSREKGSRT